MDADETDIIAAISQSENEIRAVNEWRNGDYVKKMNELRQLQDKLNAAIRNEEKHHRTISDKLDEISQLKIYISGLIPKNNGFKFNEQKY